MRSVARHLTLLLPLCLGLGCDDKKSADEKSADKSAEKKTESEAPEVDDPKVPEKPAVKMVEHDLTTAGADWEGWTAQGPEGAKVMGDLGKAARIAGDGLDSFDLLFLPKKTDLAELKGSVETGVAASGGDTATFSSDTPELLEWARNGEGWVSYNFAMNMTVGDREVTCKTLNGVSTEPGLAEMKAACATLAKK